MDHPPRGVKPEATHGEHRGSLGAATSILLLLLFMLLPPRRAVLTAFLFAWLFLPMAGYRMPGILPDYTKMSATIMGVMLGALIFDTNRLLSFRLRIWDLPFLTETAKKRILGENARDLFKLDR